MSFTYDLANSVGQIRLEIGDENIDPAGICPDGKNFSDEEITYFYTAEGQNIGRAAARACEILSRKYAPLPTTFRLGPETEEMMASEYFSLLAQKLRQTYGQSAASANTNTFPTGSIRPKISYPTGN